ncbi:type II toxin-antitoxin system RelE/ParE family toxin [Streptomyces sp. NPDC096105]|uniref:type II toxin-antitoxin system RelE family toxin n=1 Tax=Streptomyces sp. NPDC096105 TaxID=3366074 RepID=UPI0038001127
MGCVTRFTPHAQRDVLRIPRPDALRILYRLTELQKAMDPGDTTALDVKALQGHGARWRLRAGDCRVVPTVEDGRLREMTVGPYEEAGDRLEGRSHGDGTCLCLEGPPHLAVRFAVRYRRLVPPAEELILCDDTYGSDVTVTEEATPGSVERAVGATWRRCGGPGGAVAHGRNRIERPRRAVGAGGREPFSHGKRAAAVPPAGMDPRSRAGPPPAGGVERLPPPPWMWPTKDRCLNCEALV